MTSVCIPMDAADYCRQIVWHAQRKWVACWRCFQFEIFTLLSVNLKMLHFWCIAHYNRIAHYNQIPSYRPMYQRCKQYNTKEFELFSLPISQKQYRQHPTHPPWLCRTYETQVCLLFCLVLWRGFVCLFFLLLPNTFVAMCCSGMVVCIDCMWWLFSYECVPGISTFFLLQMLQISWSDLMLLVKLTQTWTWWTLFHTTTRPVLDWGHVMVIHGWYMPGISAFSF